METLYRKVNTDERLPTEADVYIVGFGSAVTQSRWYTDITEWIFNDGNFNTYEIEWWLEEIEEQPEVSEGEIAEMLLEEASPIYHQPGIKSYDIPEGAIIRASQAIHKLIYKP